MREEITNVIIFFEFVKTLLSLLKKRIQNEGIMHRGISLLEFQNHHYSEVIMSTMASQITGLSIVYSTVCSGADQRKHQSSASLTFVRGEFTGDRWFPAQRASNAEDVSIWWRHHDNTPPASVRGSQRINNPLWCVFLYQHGTMNISSLLTSPLASQLLATIGVSNVWDDVCGMRGST